MINKKVGIVFKTSFFRVHVLSSYLEFHFKYSKIKHKISKLIIFDPRKEFREGDSIVINSDSLNKTFYMQKV